MDKQKKLNNHKINIDRTFAQSDVIYEKKIRVKIVNGKKIETKVKALSPNQERINDALTLYYQKQAAKIFDYRELRAEALEELGDKFKEGMQTKNISTFEEKRIKAAAIQQVIDTKILSRIKDNPKLTIGFNELIERAGTKGAETFTRQISIIDSIVGRGFRSFKRDRVNLETMKLESSVYSNMIEIIGVSYVLRSDIGKHFAEFEDFVKAEIDPITGKVFRNKRKYIENIEFTFSKEILPFIVCQATDYVSLDTKTRQGFSLHNTFYLDTYISSIQNAQEFRKFTDFTPRALQKKFGHNYKRFDKYLSEVINPCIEDFNRNDTRTLSYLLKRGGEWGGESRQPIEEFRFIISGYEKTMRDKVDPVSYYVALRMMDDDGLAEHRQEFTDVRSLALAIQEQVDSGIPALTILGGKTVENWIKEANEELRCEKEILNILKISSITDVIYDMEIMSIMSEKFNVEYIKTPSESLKYLTEVLKVKSPKILGKRIHFPSSDENFVLEVLTSAISANIQSPVHFYFTMKNNYEADGSKKTDWNKTLNMWLTNGKYKNVNVPILILNEAGIVEHVGQWNFKDSEFETDTSVSAFDISKMVKMISSKRINIQGNVL